MTSENVDDTAGNIARGQYFSQSHSWQRVAFAGYDHSRAARHQHRREA